MSGRGGARHFTKPVVDTDVLYSCLEKHQAMVSNLGQYDHISRSQGVDAKGLVNFDTSMERPLEAVSLWRDPPSANEAGPAVPPVRAPRLERRETQWPGLGEPQGGAPELLTGPCQEAGWAQCKHGPCCCQALQGRLQLPAGSSEVLGKELRTLQKGKGAPLQDKPLEKVQEGQPLQGILKRKGPVEKAATQPSCLGKDRRLKQESSDVSLDAHSFPTMFASPDLSNKAGGAKALEKAEEATGRPGQRLVAGQSLKEAMGFLPCKAKAKPKALGKAKAKGNGKAKALEKATAKAKALGKAVAKKPATGSLEKEERKHWVKIRKTCAKNPERAYLCGTTIAGSSKLHLIVEVSATRCPQYSQVIDDIWTALEKEAITKQEAKDLKEKLCSEHGC